MNFDDFARQMTLKYRVALAIAVLKGKPAHVSIDQHLNSLRNKIETDIMESDSDVTMCSDDFLMDDDDHMNDDINKQNAEAVTEADLSPNILEGFDCDNFMEEDEHQVTLVLDHSEDDAGLLNKQVGNDLKNISTQTTFCDSVQSQNCFDESESVQNSLTFCESDTVKDKVMHPKPNTIDVKGKQVKSDGSNKSFNPIDLNQLTKNTCDDSQKTQLYSLNGFFDDYTHCSASQTSICKVDNKHLYNIPSNVKIPKDSCNLKERDSANNKAKYSNPNIIQNSSADDRFKNNYGKIPIFEPPINKNISKDDINEIGTYHIQKSHKHPDTNKANAKGNFFEISDNNTLCETKNNVNIQTKHENIYVDKVNTKVCPSNILQENIFNDTNNIQSDHEKTINKINTEDDLFNTLQDDSSFDNFNQTDNEIKATNNVAIDKTNPKAGSSETFQNIFDNVDRNTNNSNTTNVLNEITNFDEADQNIPNENLIEMQLDDEKLMEESSQTELIPFKVIEEMNKIKSYLHRKEKITIDVCGTESGYKSDSQSRSSIKSFLNTSDTWINQSAHCLLKFIMDCPIILRTREISNEISMTLGRLIDRLHEEEKYPPFVEEVLETVEKLLKDVYEGDGYAEDVILRKDANIQRIFHLNRSHHIIKYTIDKITHLLEGLHSKIAENEDNALEITNTLEIENLCYIFYILEYILKRYSTTKDLLSQNNTQILSQDYERSLKRSSITDVWRKKWNPNYTSETQQTNLIKKCPEKKCSDILNKIIVKAMDGYSLISFAALQCYNQLQS